MPDLGSIVKAYDIRGVVDEQLTTTIAYALGVAFADVVVLPSSSSALVVAYDMRPSSPQLAAAFADGAATRGLEVVMAGLASTDALYFASGSMNLPGAMFTASHNPAKYNGIKLCWPGARPVGTDTGLAAIRVAAEEFLRQAADLPLEVATTRPEISVVADYAAHLRSLVDLRDLRRLKVVVDAGNGMAGLTAPVVLDSLVEVVPLYFELDGSFPNHEANPLDPANLVDLQEAVRATGADLGLAFDGDADRCFAVDERGEAVNPSAVTALIADREIAAELKRGRSAADVTVVHNVISSLAVPETIGAAGAVALRTRVGHSYIKAEMAAHDAVFGGEHSAHYYFRDFWFADTGMLTALHLLSALGHSTSTLSELVAPYNRYPASGELNSVVTDPATAIASALTEARALLGPGESLELDTLDGTTATAVSQAGGWLWWFNLRSSNTEPLLRLNVEAQDHATMLRVRDAILASVRQ